MNWKFNIIRIFLCFFFGLLLFFNYFGLFLAITHQVSFVSLKLRSFHVQMNQRTIFFYNIDWLKPLIPFIKLQNIELTRKSCTNFSGTHFRDESDESFRRQMKISVFKMFRLLFKEYSPFFGIHLPLNVERISDEL